MGHIDVVQPHAAADHQLVGGAVGKADAGKENVIFIPEVLIAAKAMFAQNRTIDAYPPSFCSFINFSYEVIV